MQTCLLTKNPLRTILLFSLCAHLAVAILSRHGVIKDDSESYVLIGTNLAQGHGYVFEPGAKPTAWRGPGYPVMLAGIFKLTHDSYEAVRFVQAFLWVGVAFCAWKIALMLFGPEAALVAAAIAGFYPEFLGFTGLLWSESLFTVLFSASLVCFISLVHSPRTSAAVALGMFLGASILTRSAAVTLVGAIVVACVAGRLSRAHGAIAVLLAALIVAPWTARNFRDYGRFMPVESNSTQNLFEGARPYTPLIFGWRGNRYLHNDPEFESLDRLPEGQRYGAAGKFALQYIARHPARYTVMLFTKTIDFWLPDFFICRNIAAGVFGAEFRPLWIPWEVFTIAVFLIILACAFLSAARSWSQWDVRLLVCAIVLFTMPHALTHGGSRYHVPLMPILIAFAAPKLLELLAYLRTRRSVNWVADSA